jgi:hypothetical protein
MLTGLPSNLFQLRALNFLGKRFQVWHVSTTLLTQFSVLTKKTLRPMRAIARAVRLPTSCAYKPQPGYHGTIIIHPFKNDTGGLLVSLRTKWRSVNNQSGALSFVVKAWYLGSEDPVTYYKRSRGCTYSLELLDAQGFKIRDIELAFVQLVDSEGKVSGIEANDSATLSNAQYRDFSSGGDWNLGWTCPTD